MAKKRIKIKTEQTTPLESTGKKQAVRSDKDTVEYKEFYDELVEIYSMPASEQKKKGFMNLLDFSKKRGVPKSTAYNYVNTESFKQITAANRFEHGKALEPVFLDGMKKGLNTGNPMAMELFLAYYKGWNKKQVVENKESYAANDLAVLMADLPQDRKIFFGQLISDIMIEAEDARLKKPHTTNTETSRS